MAYGTMSIGNAGFTKKFISALFLLMHPVGTPYASETPTSPAELYGGTWERIEDKFIMGASDTYPAGSTGGSVEHYHNYAITYSSNYNGVVGGSADYSVMAYKGNEDGSNVKASDGPTGVGNYFSAIATTANATIYFKRSVGTTTNSNALPPYYSMYIWRRVA